VSIGNPRPSEPAVCRNFPRYPALDLAEVDPGGIEEHENVARHGAGTDVVDAIVGAETLLKQQTEDGLTAEPPHMQAGAPADGGRANDGDTRAFQHASRVADATARVLPVDDGDDVALERD
jgi:hypothetical protein